jgi:hypothetical protein
VRSRSKSGYASKLPPLLPIQEQSGGFPGAGGPTIVYLLNSYLCDGSSDPSFSDLYVCEIKPETRGPLCTL